ncbi:MAG: FtsW/RodA/SpoVE family cell cycle protein [Clostridium sp.]|jgi:cell division protein FtsW|nr:FtsW/RodA/SpoVE family cell cycle protein [Clostridium sp.]
MRNRGAANAREYRAPEDTLLYRVTPHLTKHPFFTFSSNEANLWSWLRAFKAQPSVDGFFLCLVLGLLAFGLVMMFSAGYVDAQTHEGNAYAYILPQAKNALLGLVVMFIISNINPKVFRDFAYIALAVSVVLLVVVLFYHTNLGENREQIARFIAIGGISFQPSEVAKLGLIMFCAADMAARRDIIMGRLTPPSPLPAYGMARLKTKAKNLARGAWESCSSVGVYAVVIGGVSGLVFLEKHLSGTILLLVIGLVMMWLGGVKWYWFLVPIGAIVLFAVAYWVGVGFVRKLFDDYMLERIVAWLDKDYDPLGKRWQVNQSLYAIGSGGLKGLGFGQSQQKHLYVSEPHNDFIFAIICEELGYLGAIAIMLLFVLLVRQGFVIAQRQRGEGKHFNSLLCMGICFQVGLQTALNIAVVTDTIPNTGIGLPFFSYGGTSLIILLAEMGIVLSCSRYMRKKR